MTEQVPEDRTVDMSEDALILHVRGKLGFLRASLLARNISPQVYALSRRYVLDELKILRGLPSIGADEVRQYHERERTFNEQIFEE